MAPHLLRYCVVAVLILVAIETALMVRAEEPITPIGMLLVNPSAFHRKLLKVEGIVKEVRPYSKYEVASVCGASFKLSDETGTVEVVFPAALSGRKRAVDFCQRGVTGHRGRHDGSAVIGSP